MFAFLSLAGCECVCVCVRVCLCMLGGVVGAETTMGIGQFVSTNPSLVPEGNPKETALLSWNRD